jgi:Xaa-Pro aminopeptidase
MRYIPIAQELYITNRKNLSGKLLPNSIAIFNSNDIMPTNADGSMGFRQNSDLLYLSGIDQEESILVLYPDAKDSKHKEILFLKETSELIAIWEGAKFSKKEATALSGVQTVYWLQDFPTILKGLMAEAEHIYLGTNEHTRNTNEVETRDARFIKWCKEHYPLHQYHRTAPIINRLRSVKHPLEVAQMQKACDLTERGFRRLLKFVKPGVTENQIEAELIHEFIYNGSNGFAYSPIIASGINSCTLHYIENKETCKDGDIILLDVAAEYGNYASDLTRVLPVNGKFSKRQKDVYNAVLRVQKQAIQMLRPGAILKEINENVGKLVEKELVDLGLLTLEEIKNENPAWPAYKKYFMHGTSHFLGLDVHDVGYFNEPMVPGMVFTCEPGIYINAESIGVRIENDILVTEQGPVDLMKNIPVEADEIEELMNS